MTDALAKIQELAAKAESKVSKLEKALETAKNELRDYMTAARVMTEISGESSHRIPTPPSQGGVSKRQEHIVSLLGVGRENGQLPADIYKAYIASGFDDIAIDTFRTTIWRMAEKAVKVPNSSYFIKRMDNRYWLESDETGSSNKNGAAEAAPEAGTEGVAAPYVPFSASQPSWTS